MGHDRFEDETLAMGELEIVPEEYVHFTTPRSGIAGRIVWNTGMYSLTRFVAFIMNDGCDYNFTDKIAHAWRVMVGDGGVDYESSWFPIISGPNSYFGYGVIGLDRIWLDRAGTTWHPMSEQVAVADRHQHHCLPPTTPHSPGG